MRLRQVSMVAMAVGVMASACEGELGPSIEETATVGPSGSAGLEGEVATPQAAQDTPGPRFEPEAEALEVHDGIAEALAAGLELSRLSEDDVEECQRLSRPHIAAARALRARAHRLVGPQYSGLREAAGIIHKCVGCKRDAFEYCQRMQSALASARSQWQADQGAEPTELPQP